MIFFTVKFEVLSLEGKKPLFGIFCLRKFGKSGHSAVSLQKSSVSTLPFFPSWFAFWVIGNQSIIDPLNNKSVLFVVLSYDCLRLKPNYFNPNVVSICV